MSALAWLVLIALAMGGTGLAAFMWSAHSGQYEDLDGPAERLLIDAEEDRPLEDPSPPSIRNQAHPGDF